MLVRRSEMLRRYHNYQALLKMQLPQAWWYTPVVPADQEAKTEESPEFRSLRPALAI
jgi:hypothetical protein